MFVSTIDFTDVNLQKTHNLRPPSGKMMTKHVLRNVFLKKHVFFHLETIKIYFEMKKQKNAKSLQHPGFPGRLRSKY